MIKKFTSLAYYQRLVSEMEVSQMYKGVNSETPKLSFLISNSYRARIDLLLWASLTSLKANMLATVLKDSMEIYGACYTKILQKDLIIELMSDILQHLALTADALDVNLQDIIEKKAREVFHSLPRNKNDEEV